MPEFPANPPTCPCGYNLSGLPGPPWTCPECRLVTKLWPPPPEVTLSPAENRLFNLSIACLIACPALAPWVAEFRRIGPTLEPTLISIGGLAAVISSVFLSRTDNHTQVVRLFSRAIQFFFILLVACALAGIVFAVSDSLVPGH